MPPVNKVLRVPKKEMWQSEDEAERDAAMENKDKKANLLDMPDTRAHAHTHKRVIAEGKNWRSESSYYATTSPLYATSSS